MRRRVIVVGALVLLGLLVVPVVVTQLLPEKGRDLHGVKLNETTYEEVQFANSEQGIDLAGMVFLPEGDGPFPAAVFIHGAGDSHRDNAWYLTMVSYLQNHGIAVLLPDKRGCESSSGEWRGASFEDLATDTLAAVRFLREAYPETVGPIGVIGCSQGGQVAPIAATRSGDIAFVIDAVGSVVPFYSALVYEENHNLRQMGLLPGFSDVIARLSSWHIRKIKQPKFWDAIGNYDPLPYWADVSAPALVLYGDSDTNTPSKRSAKRLNSLGKPNIRVVIYEGSGHPLEDPVGRGNELVRHEALEAMGDFILSVAESRPDDST